MLGRNNGADAGVRGMRDGETGMDGDNEEDVELMALRKRVQIVSKLMSGW